MLNQKGIIWSPFVLCFLIILLIGIAAVKSGLITMNFNVLNFFDKKTALQQRFERLNYLVDNQQPGQYYDEFVPPEAKSKTSRDEFINKAVAKKEVLKHTTTINSITIKDKAGYIDRTLTECSDENCTNKIEKRIYKKWEFKEGNWYPVGEESCIRETPYDMSPEFERATSLYKQRKDQRDGPYEWQWLNCVDIQYSSIPDAEGYFTFDQNSTTDRLTIFVDNSYKIKDDLLTAFLLSHELQHAYHFIVQQTEGTKLSCYDDEIYAFTEQLNFLLNLNQEELTSISARINLTSREANSPLLTANELAKFVTIARGQCGQNFECENDLVVGQISQMVKSSPYYQKQCNSN